MNRNAAEAKASTPPLLKVSEVAGQLGLTEETIRYLILAGELPASNVGGVGRGARYRIRQHDIDAFLASRSTLAA